MAAADQSSTTHKTLATQKPTINGFRSGRVRWREAEPASMRAEERVGLFVAVCCQVVEDHGDAGRDLRDQHIAYVGGKGRSI
ncbi:MAG: hypothetical protein AAFY06_16890 [Pseudomonadota bacterium]